jgi:minichromosome maintenance protein 10
MESSTSRTDAALKRQDEIKAQIVTLQAQLAALPGDNGVKAKCSGSLKRKKSEDTILAPATPSPSESSRKNSLALLSLTLRKETTY